MSSNDGAGVDMRNVINETLRSGRRIEYASPLVGGASRNLAHDNDKVVTDQPLHLQVQHSKYCSIDCHTNFW